jgi:predicted DCC family thiol-disulfide oxidoreductase YuxK
VTYWAATLAQRGFEIGSLDEPWVAEKITMSHEELLTDIRLLTTEGKLISGADVYLYVTRRIWWAWPFYAVFSLPGFNWLIHAGYRWFARNRHHISHACRIQPH